MVENSNKNIKYLRNKTNRRYGNLLNFVEQNESRPKEIGMSTIFRDWKNQCYKDLVLLKVIYRLNTISITIPTDSVRVCGGGFDKMILRFIRKGKGLRIVYILDIPKGKNKVGGFLLLDIKT